MKKTLALLVTLTCSTQTFPMFCPGNFNSINFGDTIAQVETQCGPPESKKSTKLTANVPQEWTYYMLTSPADQGSLKFIFAFVDGKVVNITNDGVAVAATSLCNNTIVQMGNTTKQVEAACGKPAIITKTDVPGQAPTEVTEYVYGGGTPATLIFENGKLKERN